MAIDLKKPSELPPAASVGASNAIPIDNGVSVAKATPEQIVDAGRPVATESQAINGTDNTTAMTPLTTRQAIEADGAKIVERAQAWAESPTAPGDPGTKSAKTWAGEAAVSAGATAPCTDRATAEASNVPPPVDRIGVFAPSGDTLWYKRDAAGTALTTGDGAKWSPDGEVTPDHWAENTTPGTTTMSAAIQAAIDYAGTFSDGSANGDSARAVLFTGTYLVDQKITIPPTYDGLALRGTSTALWQCTTTGAALQVNEDLLFSGGDTAACSNFYNVSIVNMRFRADDAALMTTVGLLAGRCPDLLIENCQFVNFWVGIDFYHALTPKVYNCRFSVPARTNAAPAKACVRLSGVYNSVSARATGGGVYFVNNEFLGNGADRQALDHCVVIHASDGAYFEGVNHFNFYGVTGLDIEMLDTAANRQVSGVKLGGMCWFDGDLVGTTANIRIHGTVSVGGPQGDSALRGMEFRGVFLRGGGAAPYCFLYDVIDGGGFVAANGGVEGVVLTDATFSQARTTAVKIVGKKTNANRVPLLDPQVYGNQFFQGRHSGVTGGISYIDMDASGFLVTDNLFEEELIAPDYALVLDCSEYEGKGAIFSENNISHTLATTAAYTFAKSSTAFPSVGPNLTPSGRIEENDVFRIKNSVGDNSTDDTAAFDAFVQGTGTRRVSEGIYKVTKTAGTGTKTGAHKTIMANLRATVSLNASGAGTVRFLDAAVNFKADGLNLKGAHDTPGGLWQAFEPNNNFRILDSIIDGGVVEVPGSPTNTASHIAHAFHLSSTDVDGLLSIGSTYRNLSRVILKNNASTTDDSNITFAFNLFEDNYAEVLSMNTPGGTIRGILFIGNHSRDNHADNVGGSGIMYGGANTEGMRVIANYHTGDGDEIVHLEEGSRLFSVMANTGAFTDARYGIFMADNNQGGGGYKAVEKGAIIGNSLHRETRPGGTAGIDFAPNGAGIEPAKEIAVVGNVLSGWERGLRIAETPYLNLIANNVLTDNDTGIQMMRPSLMVRDNLLLGPTGTLTFQTSGMMGKQSFASETAWSGTTNLLPAPDIASGNKVGFRGWSMEFRPFTVAGTGTNYKIAPLGSSLSGDIEISVVKNASNMRFVRSNLNWDGTTLTATTLLSDGIGISFVDLREDAGDLAIRLTSGAARDACTIQVDFTGLHVIAG